MSFSRCLFIRVLLVAVISCLRMTDTIVVFSVWASNTLKMRSWMTHAPVVGVWAWFRCDLAFPFWKDSWTRADLSGSSRGPPAGALGDLRVTVRASLPGMSPRTSYSSRSEHPVRFPDDFAGLSHGAPSISFCAPSVDRMSIAASGDGFTSSENEGCGGAAPLGCCHLEEPSVSPVQSLLADSRSRGQSL